jgi:hypothetical protein
MTVAMLGSASGDSAARAAKLGLAVVEYLTWVTKIAYLFLAFSLSNFIPVSCFCLEVFFLIRSFCRLPDLVVSLWQIDSSFVAPLLSSFRLFCYPSFLLLICFFFFDISQALLSNAFLPEEKPSWAGSCESGLSSAI